MTDIYVARSQADLHEQGGFFKAGYYHILDRNSLYPVNSKSCLLTNKNGAPQ